MVYIVLLLLASHVTSYTMEKNERCELAALPAEIRFGEIIKQLINTAQTKKEAWQNISRYQRSSREARAYIAKHQELIKKQIEERFAVSLQELAEAKFDDKRVLEKAVELLQNLIGNNGYGYFDDAFRAILKQPTITKQTLAEGIVQQKVLLPTLISLTFNNEKDYQTTALALGLLTIAMESGLYNATQRTIDLNTLSFLLRGFIIGLDPKQQLSSKELEIIDLFVNAGLRLEGITFLQGGTAGLSFIEFAKKHGNNDVITYFVNKDIQVRE